MSILNIVPHRTYVIRGAALVHDMLVAGIALLISLVLRLGPISPLDYAFETLVFMAIAGSVGSFVGLNSGVWRYASLADIVAIGKTATGAILLFGVVLFLINRLGTIPRGSIIACWALMIIMLSAPRIAYRMMRNRRAVLRGDGVAKRNVLLIGASEYAEAFIKAANERPDMHCRVLGIIDERGMKTGLSIRGVRVLGNIDDIEQLVVDFARRDLGVTGIVLTKTKAVIGGEVFDTISEVAQRHHIDLLRLPELNELRGNAISDALKLRPIVLEDLLPRRPIALDSSSIRDLVFGSVVLVTGAGGSIGAELCRQLHRFSPKRMILVDNSEQLLYEIDSELAALPGAVAIESRLGNVRNRRQIQVLFNEQQPEIIFHAAAVKHVPIVENQPLEGLNTNVLGTRNVADAALSVNARAMVLISTDKAVSPSSVMGATKRMAELYCQALDVTNRTRFVTVRFGNVLGSAGSVVPLFQKQIRAGGPVTVTHPEIERYFMTIPEAAQLVLHATSRGIANRDERGRIFVLDMGQPVRIVEVARKMIQLAGLKPDRDIQIEYIGLRPGEKLYEELFQKREELVETGVEGVLSAAPERLLDSQEIARRFDQLETLIGLSDVSGAMALLESMVPDYTSNKVSGHPQPGVTQGAGGASELPAAHAADAMRV